MFDPQDNPDGDDVLDADHDGHAPPWKKIPKRQYPWHDWPNQTLSPSVYHHGFVAVPRVGQELVEKGSSLCRRREYVAARNRGATGSSKAR